MIYRVIPERPGDVGKIYFLTAEAFANKAYSDGSEPDIVNRLRDAGDLSSLVVEDGEQLIGHVAFSPATIGPRTDWVALGPISVTPSRQGLGVGSALVNAGLAQMEQSGAAGVVLLGDPGYYGRFGFVASPGLRYKGKWSKHIQARSFGADPVGEVIFHQAFGA